MKKTPIAKEEWNFAACPDRQREACLFYEFAREYVRGQIGVEIEKNYSLHTLFVLGPAIRDRLKYLPIGCHEFPELPWLQVHSAERERLLSKCTLEPGFECPFEDLLVKNKFDVTQLIELQQEMRAERTRAIEKELNEGNHRNVKALIQDSDNFFPLTNHLSYAFIEIDWRKSDRALKRAFELLLKRRPVSSDQHSHDQLGGRGGTVDKLKQLGAMRLLRALKRAEAVVNFLATESNTPPYSSAEGVLAADKRARDILFKMTADGAFAHFKMKQPE